MKEKMQTIADAVRRHRREANLTQDELARKCGLSRNYICQIETGRKSPTLGTLGEIATAVGVTLETVLCEDLVVGQLRKIVDQADARRVLADLKRVIKQLS